MKKVLFFFTVFICFSVSAQIFTVGDTTCNYFKPNYTFTVASGATPYSSQPYYNISLISNNILDISLVCNRVNYPPVQSQNPSWIDFLDFSINSYGNTGSNIQYVYAPGSSGSSGASCGSILKNMPYGSAMPSTLNWSSTQTSAIYYDEYHSFPATQCGSHVDTFYVSFRKILSTNDTIFGWLLFDTHIPSKLISYAYRYNSIIPSSFSINQDSICIGDSLNLNSIGTGYFSGVGIKNNKFHATVVGNYQLYASNGCVNTSTLNVAVLALPSPQITNSSSLICQGDSLILTGNPANGIYSGSGVSGNVFHSASIISNTVSINYIFSDQHNCTNSVAKTFSIIPLTYTMATCIGSFFNLPLNLSIDTTFTGSGIVNDYYFDSNISGVGTFSISFNSLCGKTATINMTVHPNPPAPQIVNPITTCCLGDKIPIMGSPPGGYFNATSSQLVLVENDTLFTEYFQQYELFGDSNRVIFSYDFYDSNGCGSYAYDTILVEYAYSPNSPISSCPNTTFSLTGYPNGGTFSGANIIGNTYTSPSSIGYDYGYYNYTYPSGCHVTYTLNLFTYDCVGIEEQVNNESTILVYPNPTKDILKLDIVNLNTLNSYNVKLFSIEGKVLKSLSLIGNKNSIDLSDFTQGIYYIDVNIDNFTHRSKIVIIR